jgi:hypothetical protein
VSVLVLSTITFASKTTPDMAAEVESSEHAFRSAHAQMVEALKEVREVFITSNTKTAKRVLSAHDAIAVKLALLLNYTHPRANPDNAPWDVYVAVALKRSPELDTDVAKGFCSLVLKSHKTGAKEFQSLAQAESQAKKFAVGWTTMIKAMAR